MLSKKATVYGSCRNLLGHRWWRTQVRKILHNGSASGWLTPYNWNSRTLVSSKCYDDKVARLIWTCKNGENMNDEKAWADSWTAVNSQSLKWCTFNQRRRFFRPKFYCSKRNWAKRSDYTDEGKIGLDHSWNQVEILRTESGYRFRAAEDDQEEVPYEAMGQAAVIMVILTLIFFALLSDVQEKYFLAEFVANKTLSNPIEPEIRLTFWFVTGHQ